MVGQLEHEPRSAARSPRQAALIDYAVALTSNPATMSEQDITRLRETGLSDAAIHDAAAVTAYFNFVNRIALGLGVELE
jgi:uncharacterized peroxidase-related enzyme